MEGKSSLDRLVQSDWQWFLNLLQSVVPKISQESRRKVDEIARTDQEAAKVGMENLSELPGRQSMGGAFCMCYHGNSWRR